MITKQEIENMKGRMKMEKLLVILLIATIFLAINTKAIRPNMPYDDNHVAENNDHHGFKASSSNENSSNSVPQEPHPEKHPTIPPKQK